MSLRSKIYNLINGILIKKFRREIIKTGPKEAILFAKKYFKGKEIIAGEIGVYYGENAKDINKQLNVKKIYLIDPYEKYEGYKRDPLINDLKKAKKNAHKINKLFKNIIWIEEFSEKAYLKIKDFFDFLYIDGNHEYKYVKKDLELYWPKIKSKGIISGHDINYQGVSKAVIEFARKNKLEVQFGDRRDWWIIKE